MEVVICFYYSHATFTGKSHILVFLHSDNAYENTAWSTEEFAIESSYGRKAHKSSN